MEGKKRRRVQSKKVQKSGLTKEDWIKLDGKFEENEKAYDRIIFKLIQHEERMELFVTKDAFQETMHGIHGTLDEIVGMLRKKDTEDTSIKSAIHRHEEKIEAHDGDIKRIKQHTHLS